MASRYSAMKKPGATVEEGGLGCERDHVVLLPGNVGREDRYVIQRMVASGGGVLPTYRALSSVDGKKVLMRVFVSAYKLSPSEEKELLKNMEKRLCSLNTSVCPSFVDCFADETPEGSRRLFIAHDSPPGESLEELVQKGWLFSEEEIIGIAVETLHAIPYLNHQRYHLKKLSKKLLKSRQPRHQKWEIQSFVNQSNVCPGNIFVDVERAARVGGSSWVGHVKLLPGLGAPWTAGPPRGAAVVTWPDIGNNDVAIPSPPLGFADTTHHLERQRPIVESDFFAVGLTALYMATGEPPSLTMQDLRFRDRVRLRDHVQMTERLAETLERLLLFHYVPGSSYGFHNRNDVIQALQSRWTSYIAGQLGLHSAPPTGQSASGSGPNSSTSLSSTLWDPVFTSSSSDPNQVELLVIKPSSQSSSDYVDVSEPDRLPAQQLLRVNLGPFGYEESCLIPENSRDYINSRKPSKAVIETSSDGRELRIDINPSTTNQKDESRSSFYKQVKLFLLLFVLIYPPTLALFLHDKQRFAWLFLFPALHLFWGLLLACCMLGDCSYCMSVKMVGGGAYTISKTEFSDHPKIEAQGLVANIREVRLRARLSGEGDVLREVEGCEVIEIGGKSQRFGDTMLDEDGKVWLVGEINGFLRKQR